MPLMKDNVVYPKYWAKQNIAFYSCSISLAFFCTADPDLHKGPATFGSCLLKCFLHSLQSHCPYPCPAERDKGNAGSGNKIGRRLGNDWARSDFLSMCSVLIFRLFCLFQVLFPKLELVFHRGIQTPRNNGRVLLLLRGVWIPR